MVANRQSVLSLEDIDPIDEKKLEEQYVYAVYDDIAWHFALTRYKPWPHVHNFLEKQSVGSLVLDVGCGNGKYLNCLPQGFIIGSDRCKSLLKISKNPVCKVPEFVSSGIGLNQFSTEVLVSDCTRLTFRSNIADAVISVAVIHHLATVAKRVEALRELARCARADGLVLLVVWAYEQEADVTGARIFPSQNVLLPWNLQSNCDKSRQQDSEASTPEIVSRINREAVKDSGISRTLYRYYHLFRKEELLDLITENFADVFEIKEISFVKNNWFLVLKKKFQSQFKAT